MSVLGRIAGPIRRLGLLAEQDTDAASFSRFFTTTTTATGGTATEYDLAGGGRITATHGFGVQPTSVTAMLSNIQTEHGFPVGEEISYSANITDGGSGTTRRGGQVSADTSTVSFQYENSSLYLINTAGNAVILTATNWRVVMRCRA